MSRADLFLELCGGVKKGISRKVRFDEFTGKYKSLWYNNGNPWARQLEARGYNMHVEKSGGKTEYVQIIGRKKNQIGGIPNHIQKEIRKRPCALTGVKTKNIEVDHKDGRKDDQRLNDNPDIDDFQALSKDANIAKRTACNDCQNTARRFDATQLGFTVSQVLGGKRYEGSCVGCFWHDIEFFRKQFVLK